MSRKENEKEVIKLLNELEDLTSRLKVPPYRRRDFRWLEHNIKQEDVNHGFYVEFKELINEIKIRKNDCLIVSITDKLSPFEE